MYHASISYFTAKVHLHRDKIDALLEEFSDVLSNKSGRTSVMTMDIQTETEIPICLRQYCVPDKLADKVEFAVHNLMEEGIIEPSTAAELTNSSCCEIIR